MIEGLSAVLAVFGECVNLDSGEFCSPSIRGEIAGDAGALVLEIVVHFSPVAAVAVAVLPPPLSCLRLVIVLFMHRFNGSLFSLFSADDVNGLPDGQYEVVGVCSTANCEFSR